MKLRDGTSKNLGRFDSPEEAHQTVIKAKTTLDVFEHINKPEHWREYIAQKSAAKRRRIPFLLTYDQWWDYWQKSGHWNERGKRSNQYCMARFGDQGAYKKGNVEIITTRENMQQRNPIVHTDEFKQALSLRSIGNNWNVGRKHSRETKRKMRLAWDRRRAKV